MIAVAFVAYIVGVFTVLLAYLLMQSDQAKRKKRQGYPSMVGLAITPELQATLQEIFKPDDVKSEASAKEILSRYSDAFPPADRLRFGERHTLKLATAIADECARTEIEVLAYTSMPGKPVYSLSRLEEPSGDDAEDKKKLRRITNAVNYIEMRGDALPYKLESAAGMAWFEDRPAQAVPTPAEAGIRMVDDYTPLAAQNFSTGDIKPSRPLVHPMQAAAIETLQRLRYTWEGGMLWKPPIGKTPEDLL